MVISLKILIEYNYNSIILLTSGPRLDILVKNDTNDLVDLY
jgi:hypothetical protein